jgi:signal transduction histidine kinase
LLDEIRDLLPGGRLEPMDPESSVENGERVLAALPVRLMPGDFSQAAARNASPLRISLTVAWICVLLAAAAVAVLLQGALSLSERRGAFVSAVTHEMRTPLTTFRMYTEMLVKGMVPPDKRTRYLDTLRIEADRLAHLVENVLAYARLERGKMASRMELTTPAAIVERARGRLADRAEQAGMVLQVDGPQSTDLSIQADPTAVEQILFNLVDNACKYAAAAADKSIHLGVRDEGGSVSFEVSDHGPGVSPDQLARLFRPFSKSAQQAAHSAPGVGLGLALSRRLARRMGGDLCYDRSRTGGATFVLRLPHAV